MQDQPRRPKESLARVWLAMSSERFQRTRVEGVCSQRNRLERRSVGGERQDEDEEETERQRSE